MTIPNHQMFENQFFSRSMHQSFNDNGANFESDEKESAFHKWMRASGKLNKSIGTLG